eukprot:1155635-Pelagomonas_calceolata.AAC.21
MSYTGIFEGVANIEAGAYEQLHRLGAQPRVTEVRLCTPVEHAFVSVRPCVMYDSVFWERDKGVMCVYHTSRRSWSFAWSILEDA